MTSSFRPRWLELCTVLLAGCSGVDDPLPNVVLVTLDTTRADRLGCYGYGRPTSPNLDALAEHSILFRRAYSVSSWTLPAHASLFTGKLPKSHGARYDPHGPLDLASAIEGPDEWSQYRARGLGAQETTLAELLRARGYATGAVVAGPWMKRLFGLGAGFDSYDDSGIEANNGRPASDVTDAAIRWIEGLRASAEAGTRRPFFLFLNYYDPHYPLLPPPEFRDLFVPEGRRAGELSVQEGYGALYDAEIRGMDHHFGRLLRRLEELGLYGETWIVVTADHGELLGENDQLGHGRFLTEQELHVPLIVKEPSPTPSRERVDRLVQLPDVFAFLLEQLEIEAPTGVQGQSLFAVERPIVAEVRPLPVHGGNGDWQALVEGDLKFAWNSQGKHTLVDLSADPGETENLLATHGELASAMEARLHGFLESLPDPPPLAPGASGQTVDEETQRALQALGYTD